MEWGAHEEYAKKSLSVAKHLYPSAHIEVQSGFNHCEYVMKKNEPFASGKRKT